jgi:hypothetical protein
MSIRGAVWGKTVASGNEQLAKLVSDYERIGIYPYEKSYRRSPLGDSVQFDNGDFWRVLRATESSRGHCVNISYIEHGIDERIIRDVILPVTKSYPFQASQYYFGESE